MLSWIATRQASLFCLKILLSISENKWCNFTNTKRKKLVQLSYRRLISINLDTLAINYSSRKNFCIYHRAIRHHFISPHNLACVKYEKSQRRLPRFMYTFVYIYMSWTVTYVLSSRMHLFIVVDAIEGHTYCLPGFYHHHRLSFFTCIISMLE